MTGITKREKLARDKLELENELLELEVLQIKYGFAKDTALLLTISAILYQAYPAMRSFVESLQPFSPTEQPASPLHTPETASVNWAASPIGYVVNNLAWKMNQEYLEKATTSIYWQGYPLLFAFAGAFDKSKRVSPSEAAKQWGELTDDAPPPSDGGQLENERIVFTILGAIAIFSLKDQIADIMSALGHILEAIIPL